MLVYLRGRSTVTVNNLLLPKCYHTKTEVADQTWNLPHSQYFDSKPASSSTDPRHWHQVSGRVWLSQEKKVFDTWSQRGHLTNTVDQQGSLGWNADHCFSWYFSTSGYMHFGYMICTCLIFSLDLSASLLMYAAKCKQSVISPSLPLT